MVATVADLLDSPQYAARVFWQTVNHPAIGPLRYAGLGYTVSGYSNPAERAPVLGEHSSAIDAHSTAASAIP